MATGGGRGGGGLQRSKARQPANKLLLTVPGADPDGDSSDADNDMESADNQFRHLTLRKTTSYRWANYTARFILLYLPSKHKTFVWHLYNVGPSL